jgi:hypothetical protein
LTEAVEAPEVSLAPDFIFAAFSRMAASFWALGPSPPILIAPGLGMKSLMGDFLMGGGVFAIADMMARRRPGCGCWVGNGGGGLGLSTPEVKEDCYAIANGSCG